MNVGGRVCLHASLPTQTRVHARVRVSFDALHVSRVSKSACMCTDGRYLGKRRHLELVRIRRYSERAKNGRRRIANLRPLEVLESLPPPCIYIEHT